MFTLVARAIGTLIVSRNSDSEPNTQFTIQLHKYTGLVPTANVRIVVSEKSALFAVRGQHVIRIHRTPFYRLLGCLNNI